MSSLIDSEAVLRQRAAQFGMTKVQIDAIVDSGHGSLARFAFCCNHAPQNADETPLINEVTNILGGAPTASVMGLFRRLFFEAYTLASQDLRQRIERVEDAPPRRMAAPERAHRYTAQAARLVGLVLLNELEPSDALVDLAAQQYDDNRLSYIEWSLCTKKAQEINGIKKIAALTSDASGVLKLHQASEGPTAQLETDLLVRYALQRRGLAFDQANLIEFRLHDTWVDTLIEAKLREPPSGYVKLSWQQILNADRALFLKMCELTRAGIVLNAAGARPLDSAIALASMHASVSFLLMPLPSGSKDAASASSGVIQTILKAPGAPSLPGQGKRSIAKAKAKALAASNGGKVSGKAAGKSAGKLSRVAMPLALKGMYYRDAAGNSLCHNFNLPCGCALPVDSTTNACAKGVHACCKPKCGGKHSLQVCTSV
jgi:hypothetical protein